MAVKEPQPIWLMMLMRIVGMDWIRGVVEVRRLFSTRKALSCAQVLFFTVTVPN